MFNPLNAELNPICHLLALFGAHHILHVSRIRVKSLVLFNYVVRRVACLQKGAAKSWIQTLNVFIMDSWCT